MTTAEEVRDRLVEFFRKDLVGPAHGTNEELEEKPSIRYSAGVLFPPATPVDESSEAGGLATDSETTSTAAEGTPLDTDEHEASANLNGDASAEDAVPDDAVTLANTYKPSAIALSFLVAPRTTKLVIVPYAATYERTQGENRRATWRRQELPLTEETFPLNKSRRASVERTISSGLRLRLVSRPRRDGTTLCTACLYNVTHEGQEFFQVRISLKGDGHEAFSEYASAAMSATDDEELALAMLYRERRVFAVGHGCAVDWTSSGKYASELATATVPAVTIPPVLPSAGEYHWLDMQYLSGDGASDEQILSALEEFVSDYRGWISRREVDALDLEAAFAAPARKHLDNCASAADRMAAGIAELRNNQHSLESFKLMNAAMLRQQLHSRLRPRAYNDPPPPAPEYESAYSKNRIQGYWRRFQLAFVLMSLVGCTPDGGQDERELVDLIWFPTGVPAHVR